MDCGAWRPSRLPAIRAAKPELSGFGGTTNASWQSISMDHSAHHSAHQALEQGSTQNLDAATASASCSSVQLIDLTRPIAASAVSTSELRFVGNELAARSSGWLIHVDAHLGSRHRASDMKEALFPRVTSATVCQEDARSADFDRRSSSRQSVHVMTPQARPGQPSRCYAIVAVPSSVCRWIRPAGTNRGRSAEDGGSTQH
jgi:hypothetical protein